MFIGGRTITQTLTMGGGANLAVAEPTFYSEASLARADAPEDKFSGSGDAALELMELVDARPERIGEADIRTMAGRAKVDSFFGRMLGILARSRTGVSDTALAALSEAARSNCGSAYALQDLSLDEEKLAAAAIDGLWMAAGESSGAARAYAELADLKPSMAIDVIARLGKLAEERTHAAKALGWLARKRPERSREIFDVIKTASSKNGEAVIALGDVIAADPKLADEAVPMLVQRALSNIRRPEDGAEALGKLAISNALLARAMREAMTTGETTARNLFPYMVWLIRTNVEMADALAKGLRVSPKEWEDRSHPKGMMMNEVRRAVSLSAAFLFDVSKKYPELALVCQAILALGNAAKYDTKSIFNLAELKNENPILSADAIRELEKAKKFGREARWALKTADYRP